MLGVWWSKQHPGFSGVYYVGPKGASHLTKGKGVQQGWRAEWFPWDHPPCGAARMPLLAGLLGGLYIEHSRSMTPFHCSGPQTCNTPSSCLSCCYIQEATRANPQESAPGWTHPIPFHLSHHHGQVKYTLQLVYGNTEFYLGVWPVTFYLSLGSPRLEQGVSKTLASRCK